jgi:hypothetical protein
MMAGWMVLLAVEWMDKMINKYLNGFVDCWKGE